MYILDISHSVRNTLIFLTTQLYKTQGKTDHKSTSTVVVVFITRERILVFPAASNPNIKILISLLPNIFESSFPILIQQSLASENRISFNIINISLEQPPDVKTTIITKLF